MMGPGNFFVELAQFLAKIPVLCMGGLTREEWGILVDEFSDVVIAGAARFFPGHDDATSEVVQALDQIKEIVGSSEPEFVGYRICQIVYDLVEAIADFFPAPIDDEPPEEE